MWNRAGWLAVFGVVAAVVVLAASGPAAATLTAATGGATTAATVDCPATDDGVVFVTDSGLEVIHDGRSMGDNPFVNETTLSFPNVTVSANDNASLQVTSATERRLCVTDVEPTDAAVSLAPAEGPRIVVVDRLGNLTYGTVDYERTETGADLAYSAPTTARIEIIDARLQPGDAVQAVDAEDRTVFDTGRVTDNGTLELRLPDGSETVDLRLAPAATETGTADSNEDVASSADDGSDSGGTVATDSSTSGTETEATPNGSTQSSRSLGWTAELVDYHPSPQTQHVGGFLPVALLLWLLALWLFLTRESRETTLLVLVLVTASIRATSDLIQVMLDGLVGVETPIAAINFVLELSLAVLFVQFAAAYVNEDRLRTRRAKLGLGAVAALGTASILTNSFHGLVFADVNVAGGPFTYVTATAGPGGWLLFALNTCLLAGGGLLILRSLLGPSVRTVWRPVAVVGTGLCLAVLIGVISVLDWGPVPGYDYTAAGVNYFILLTAVTLAGHGLQRLKSSGQKSVIADLEDAIVILDDTWTVVEFNPVARRLLPDIDAGRPFDTVLAEPLDRPTAGETTKRELSLMVDAAAANPAQDPVAGTDGGEDLSRIEPDGGLGDQHGSADVPARDPLEDVIDDSGTGDPPDSEDDGSRSSSPESNGAMVERHGQDRERRHFIVKATTVTTETSAVIGFTVQFADVTDLKRRMQNLEAKNDQLDRFASALTQDLRTPLTEAESITDRAIETLESAEGADSMDRSQLSWYFEQIDNALDRMVDIIEDVLGLARGSDIETDPRPVEFGRIAERAWETADRSRATLRIESSGDVLADPDHLQHLLEQLFRNAVEYGSTSPDSQARQDAVEHGSTSPRSASTHEDAAGTSSGEPSVANAPEDADEQRSSSNQNATRSDDAVEHGSTSPRSASTHEDAVEHDSEDVTVRIGLDDDGFYVADDGPGVPEEVRGELFEAGVTTKEHGSGLGLAIAVHRAAAHGWEIGLDADHEGARFVVTGCDTSPDRDTPSEVNG